MTLQTLYRPVGLTELRLIFEAGMRAFPARLPEQPIFYPVTNEAYAAQIAREWNAAEPELACGYVLSFALPAAYLERFDKKVVGGAEHEELWVPAEVLPDFNARLEGLISVGRCFFGERFRGYAAPTPSFGGLDEAFHREDAAAQLAALLANEGRLVEFVEAYPTTIFLHHPYWRGLVGSADSALAGEKASTVLAELAAAWRERFVIPLPLALGVQAR